jgi:hypothetical protein
MEGLKYSAWSGSLQEGRFIVVSCESWLCSDLGCEGLQGFRTILLNDCTLYHMQSKLETSQNGLEIGCELSLDVV